jgi:hypothetical protein
MLALAYEGLALVSDGLVTEGMGKLDESSTAAISGELRGVDEAGTIACCLIAACERVRDVGRAAEWCQRLRELSERWAFELMIAVCRTHYASTLVARGQWREAEREFRAAIAGFGHPHRGQAAEAQVRLADLLVRRGRLDEAAELLDTVDAGAGRMMGHTIALAVRAALLLEGGDPQGAADTAETSLRAMPGPESLERAPALETLVQANIALGDERRARAALAGLRTLADLVRTEPMLAAARFAQGAVAHAFGNPAAGCPAGCCRPVHRRGRPLRTRTGPYAAGPVSGRHRAGSGRHRPRRRGARHRPGPGRPIDDSPGAGPPGRARHLPGARSGHVRRAHQP